MSTFLAKYYDFYQGKYDFSAIFLVTTNFKNKYLTTNVLLFFLNGLHRGIRGNFRYMA